MVEDGSNIGPGTESMMRSHCSIGACAETRIWNPRRGLWNETHGARFETVGIPPNVLLRYPRVCGDLIAVDLFRTGICVDIKLVTELLSPGHIEKERLSVQ